MINDDQKELIVDLRAKGYSYDKISSELNISKPTLIKITRSLELEIQNRKELQRDYLNKKYELTQHNQIEKLGKIGLQIWGELSKRDMVDIPTLKLVELLNKNYDQLSKVNQEEVIFSEEDYKNSLNLTEKITWQV